MNLSLHHRLSGAAWSGLLATLTPIGIVTILLGILLESPYHRRLLAIIALAMALLIA